MKSLYYQFVNFIKTMPNLWFLTIWLLTFSLILTLVVRFYKIYNGEQKKFEKVSLLVIALILFAILVYLTYIRK